MWMKNEDELVMAVLQGDHGSFELLLRPYRRGLLNMAYRMTGNTEEAKEVCQEALIRIFRYLNKFKKGRNFKNWIYKIVVNTGYDFLRRKKKYEEIVKNLSDMLWNVVTMNRKERIPKKAEVKDLATLSDWKFLVKRYVEAHNLALKKFKK